MSDALLTLQPSPAAGFDQPLDMLDGCHERLRRSLALLERLSAHLSAHGADPQAQEAARDVLRYFDLAAPIIITTKNCIWCRCCSVTPARTPGLNKC